MLHSLFPFLKANRSRIHLGCNYFYPEGHEAFIAEGDYFCNTNKSVWSFMNSKIGLWIDFLSVILFGLWFLDLKMHSQELQRLQFLLQYLHLGWLGTAVPCDVQAAPSPPPCCSARARSWLKSRHTAVAAGKRADCYGILPSSWLWLM